MFHVLYFVPKEVKNIYKTEYSMTAKPCKSRYKLRVQGICEEEKILKNAH